MHLYFIHPHLGGTYTVYRALHEALKSIGIDLRCFNESCAPQNEYRSEEETAKRCIEEIIKLSPEVVYINILSSKLLTNLSRYIPSEIPVVAIVHNITPGTYAPVKAYKGNISHVVAVSPRIATDLKRIVPHLRNRISVVPSSVDSNVFYPTASAHATRYQRSFLFVGRIEDSSKGISKIAKVFCEPQFRDCRLTIVGDGPDLGYLKNALTSSLADIHFLGALNPFSVASEMRRHMFFLSPSNFEGQLLANLEAMACGCIPITSKIRGVTDVYVKHNYNGLMVRPLGSRSLRLAVDRALRMSPDERNLFSSRACKEASNYSSASMSSGYRELVSRLLVDSSRYSESIDVYGWSYPPSIDRTAFFRTFIPARLKTLLRQLLSGSSLL